jgi:uncharacterized membrane protein YdjX (TVP38/TMEM64 family)
MYRPIHHENDKMKRYIPIIILLFLALVAWGAGVHRFFSFDILRNHHQTIEMYIHTYPILSTIVYMGAYIAIVGLSIPGATILTVIGGLLFGQWVGTLVVVTSATIGATVLFISAKLASQDLLRKKAGNWVEKMRRGFQENAFYYMLTLRLIPIFPFVAVNLVAALLQIPLRTFLLTTFVGIIPGSFAYVCIGDALKDVILSPVLTPKIVLEPKMLYALVALGILSLLPVFYNRYMLRKSSKP